MDKRHYIKTREYKLSNGVSFTVNVYKKMNNRGISIRCNYGSLEAYISSRTTDDLLDKMILRSYKKFSTYSINRPYYVDNKFIYVFGEKLIITHDVFFKKKEGFFYLSPNSNDPITKYKRLYLQYLNKRVVEIGKIMNRDLSDWTIRTGLYLSFFGICYNTKKIFKFDYRTFAFNKEIIDALIIHEISHTYISNHSSKFYDVVYKYCPNYDKLDMYLNRGYFKGEVDELAIKNNRK